MAKFKLFMQIIIIRKTHQIYNHIQMANKNIDLRKNNNSNQVDIDEKSQSFWDEEEKYQTKIGKTMNKFYKILKQQQNKNEKIEQVDILKKRILDKKTRKINKFKNKINQYSSSEQEIIRPKSDSGSENSQNSSFHEQNQVSEYYSIDPEANAYQFNKKSKKNAELNTNKSCNQEKFDQQFVDEENIENFDWSILENQKFSPQKQNILDNELSQRKQQEIDQPLEANAKFMEKMWKYGIDKLCHSIESLANRSTKLQKLIYVSFQSMMQTIQIINHNKRQSDVSFPRKSDDYRCYLLTNSKPLDKINPRPYPKEKKQMNKYEEMLKRSQTEQEKKLIQIQRHIKELKNQRKKLTQSLSLTRKRCRYSQENRNFSKQYQKSIEGSEQQMICGKNRNRNERGIQMHVQENYKQGSMIKSIYRNNGLKQSTKVNKQIDKDKSLSASQNGQVWKEKDQFQSSGEEQIQFNDIIQEFAVGTQFGKSEQTQSININFNGVSSEAQKQAIKIQNESARNDNFIPLIPRQIKSDDRRQVKIENQINDKIKLEQKGLGFKDKMFKKLQAIKRDSERTKLKRQQQAQQNIQRIAKAKQERQKKANQTDKKQNGVSRANKQMQLFKHINKSSAVKYKRVQYYFSEIDKHLQLTVMDRDTANSLSDDNHQKIITISPQLDHEYSLHRVHLRIVNVEYWVAIGICDIDQVKKNRCIMKVRQFGHHGVYMLGSNGFCYSNYIQEDHRIDKGFKFKNGDIIRVNVDSTNCLISFIKNKGGADAQKYSMKYNPSLQLCKIRFCVGLCRTKDIIRIQNCKNPFLQ